MVQGNAMQWTQVLFRVESSFTTKCVPRVYLVSTLGRIFYTAAQRGTLNRMTNMECRFATQRLAGLAGCRAEASRVILICLVGVMWSPTLEA